MFKIKIYELSYTGIVTDRTYFDQVAARTRIGAILKAKKKYRSSKRIALHEYGNPVPFWYRRRN